MVKQQKRRPLTIGQFKHRSIDTRSDIFSLQVIQLLGWFALLRHFFDHPQPPAGTLPVDAEVTSNSEQPTANTPSANLQTIPATPQPQHGFLGDVFGFSCFAQEPARQSEDCRQMALDQEPKGCLIATG
jgi:hypothetical protein